jgi:hypothetical protein
MHKYLVIGSAPYMSEWISKHLNWFVENDYRIICFNNSWKLVPLNHIYLWFHSTDFQKANTYVPTMGEIPHTSRINSHGHRDGKLPKFLPHIPGLDALHCIKRGIGTMYFNVIYNLLRSHGTDASVVVIGCDMIYTKNGDTFYSSEKNSKARNDPLNRWGDENLTKECNNSDAMFAKYGNPIMNASTHKTRLPYTKFTKHLYPASDKIQDIWSIFTIYSDNYRHFYENFKKNKPSTMELNSSQIEKFNTRASNIKWTKSVEYLKAHINEYVIICDTTSILNKNLNIDILSDIERYDMMVLKGYRSEHSKINAGCMIVKSNDNVIRFFERICSDIEQKKQWGQAVINDLLYHEQYNKSNENSKYNITWRYMPDKFATIVSCNDDSIANIPKDIYIYKFIRRNKMETYDKLLEYLTKE